MHKRASFDLDAYIERIQNNPCFICEMIAGRLNGNHVIHQNIESYNPQQAPDKNAGYQDPQSARRIDRVGNFLIKDILVDQCGREQEGHVEGIRAKKIEYVRL